HSHLTIQSILQHSTKKIQLSSATESAFSESNQSLILTHEKLPFGSFLSFFRINEEITDLPHHLRLGETR
ncbi:MAG: hypothetical protein P1V97_00155, partial [Planctomycetota bacterium]|nr:hypothetical protein [Planctomycetota bacterium]